VDSLVKQRLVGALILTALAVVFWPIIFVPGEDRSEGLVVVVPPEPPVDRTPLPEPDTAGLRALGDAAAQAEPVPDVDLPDDLFAASSDEPEEAQEDSLPELAERNTVLPERSLESVRDDLVKPELDADGLPIAFSLQVATMTDRERAEALRDELVAAGYKGYLKRLRRDDKTLYRVLVGPKFQRDDLVAVKAAVDDAWRVESLIIRYLP
jgi:DedD protein